MPQIKSAAKALRSSQRKQVYNLRTKRKFKQAVKAVREAAKAKDKKKAQEILPQAYRELDIAAKKHIIHRNKASRLKSRLAKSVEKTAT
ncbi:30S ribosomal protein S20 [Patescibacteria group bacterium]|nr:30S ribosomal protein S20 [Patescibacteria group bacterium]